MQRVSRGNSRRHAFTLVELVVVVVVLFLFGIVFIVTIATPNTTHRRPSVQSMQVHDILRAMVIDAQGNNFYYPGLDAEGHIVDGSPEYRFELLLRRNLIAPETLISPGETAVPWTGGPMTQDNYSYALLRVEDAAKDAGRLAEWRCTNNADAVVISDRNVVSEGSYSSVYTVGDGSNRWRGTVGWNDGHVSFEPDHQLSTQYGDAVTRKNDNIFVAEDTDDAMMVFSQYDPIPTPRRMPPQDARWGFWIAVFICGLGLMGLWIGLTKRAKRTHPPQGEQ